MTRKQSAMVVGSSSRSAFGSQRAAIKQKHRRSLRYTRTLDIILEETQQQQQQQQQCQHQQYQAPNAEEQHISLFRSPCSSHRLEQQQQQQDRSISCESSPNTAAAAAAVSMTDFWHSMRSMKKSATIVSLDSLLAAEDSNVTATNTSPESMEALGACVVSEDEENYDNFLDDWDL